MTANKPKRKVTLITKVAATIELLWDDETERLEKDSVQPRGSTMTTVLLPEYLRLFFNLASQIGNNTSGGGYILTDLVAYESSCGTFALDAQDILEAELVFFQTARTVGTRFCVFHPKGIVIPGGTHIQWSQTINGLGRGRKG